MLKQDATVKPMEEAIDARQRAMNAERGGHCRAHGGGRRR